MIRLFPENRIVILVRHGESEGNVDHTVYDRKPHQEIALTDKGNLQAVAVGKSIRKYISDIVYAYPGHICCAQDGKPIKLTDMRFYCSPYVRAQETLLGILTCLTDFPCKVDGDLLCSEQSWGAAEGTSSYEDYIERLPVAEAALESEMYRKMGYLWYTPTRGESLMDVYQRAGLFLEKYRWFESSKVAILSAHKIFLTMLHYYLIGGRPQPEEIPKPGGWQNGEARIYRMTERNTVHEQTLLLPSNLYA